jgi:hypothetical protein
MKTVVDERLVQEATAYRLRFACPHCAYFDAARETCSEGYPTDEHRDSGWNRSEVLFCKLFECGA